ncbi:MAG: hypothetical protein QOE74_492, partial [Mycobacterium sp.]|nr:hypothetical protein [Mycobacterium sp.]
MPFQHVAQREELEDVLWRPLRDSGAPPRHVLDESLLGEQPESLTQRRPADAEVGTQLLFDDLLAGLQRATQNRVAQAVGGQFDEGRRQREPVRA